MKLKTKILSIMSGCVLATSLPIVLTSCAQNNSWNSFNLSHYYVNPALDNMKTLTVSEQPVELTYGQEYIFNINLADWKGDKPDAKTKWMFAAVQIIEGQNPKSIQFDLSSLKIEINNVRLIRGTDFAINDHIITGLERSAYYEIGWDAKIKITAKLEQASQETNDEKVACFPILSCESARPTPVTDEYNLDYFDEDYPALVSGAAKQTISLNVGTKYKFKASMSDWTGAIPAGGINWGFAFLDAIYFWMPLKVIDISDISVKINNTTLVPNVDFVLLEDKSGIIGKGAHEKLNSGDNIEIETKVKYYIANEEVIKCYPILSSLQDTFSLSEFKTKKVIGGSLTGLTVANGGAFLISQREYTFEINTADWDESKRREGNKFNWAFALINSPLQQILPLNTGDGQSSLTINGESKTYHNDYAINNVPISQGNGHVMVGANTCSTMNYDTSVKIKVTINAPTAIICVFPILYDITPQQN